MQEQIDIPRDKRALERLADIAAGYVLIACIAAMGLFCMATTLALVKIERGYAVAARV